MFAGGPAHRPTSCPLILPPVRGAPLSLGEGVQGAERSALPKSNPAKSIACRFYAPANNPRSNSPHNHLVPVARGGRLDPAQSGGGDRLSGAAGGSRKAGSGRAAYSSGARTGGPLSGTKADSGATGR